MSNRISDVAVIAKKETAAHRIAVSAAGVLLFVIATAAAAKIKIYLPFTPVPITLQPMLVLLSGGVLGGRLGAISMFVYVALGAAGLPMFAGNPGSGIAVLTGATGGYLFSYPIVSWMVGMLTRKSNRLIVNLLVMFLGMTVIYLFGIVWLALFMKIDFYRAFMLGGAPFLLSDIVKAILAASISWRFRHRSIRVFNHSKSDG